MSHLFQHSNLIIRVATSGLIMSYTKKIVSLSIILLIVFLVSHSRYEVKGTDDIPAPSFIMRLQFEIYTIDSKTETLYTSNYEFLMKALDPKTPDFAAVILKPHFYEAERLLSSNETGTNQVYDHLRIGEPELLELNRWRLNPKRCCPSLGSPWDHYELSFLMALNISTKLDLNYTWFIMPIPLQGDWNWIENPKIEKLSTVPDNQTLISCGLNPEKFYAAGGNNMTDFYLITETFSFAGMYSTRISLIYFAPSVLILFVLAISAVRFKKLSTSNFLTLYLGTAFFILSFLVSFAQYAPSTVLTWQEILFYVDFLFCTALVVTAIYFKKKKKPSSGDDTKELILETGKDMKASAEGEGQRNGSEPTVESINKAFEWLVLVQTVLLSVIFQVLIWIMKPETNYKLTAQLMFSLTMPLIVSIITWFGQLITSKTRRQIVLRLLSWSILAMVFSYYIMMFFVLVVLGITREFSIVVAGSLLAGSLVVAFFPSKRILSTYKTATADNEFWKRRAVAIWSPYIMGTSIAGILILVPFLF